MEISTGVVIEIVNNLIQAAYLVGFLYLFLDKKTSNVFNIVSYCSATLLIFMMSNYYTYHELTFSHSDAVFGIAILMVYSLICLKGKVILRIIMPVVDMLISAVCSYATFNLFSLLGKRPFVEALTFSNVYRYMFVIVCHVTTIFVFWLVLRISKKRIRINNLYEIVAFIIVPVVSLVGMYSVMIAYEHSDFDPNILWYILTIVVVLIINTVVFWIIVDKICKDNSLKTQLLLSEQREEMYKTSVLMTSEQLDRMSKIKHDIKNQLKSVKKLIANEQYDDAIRLCDDTNVDITNVHTPITTTNPTLNAIMNVEVDRATELGLSFKYNISDPLLFVSPSDIVSIIGNLCDNAIEYLVHHELDSKRISIDIYVRKDYYIISCKNTIGVSVLDSNPSLKSTKEDMLLHGKGISILKDIAKKYQGEVKISEENNAFEATVVIRNTQAG